MEWINIRGQQCYIWLTSTRITRDRKDTEHKWNDALFARLRAHDSFSSTCPDRDRHEYVAGRDCYVLEWRIRNQDSSDIAWDYQDR